MIKTNKKELEAKKNQTDIEKNKHIAILSYAWIFFLIPLLLRPKSKFCQHHAKQGSVLFLLSILSMVPFVGWLFGTIIIVVSIIGALKTFDGEWWKPLASKQKAKNRKLKT